MKKNLASTLLFLFFGLVFLSESDANGVRNLDFVKMETSQ